MKILKRIIFVILVIINLALLFIPEMFYWIIKGHGFLNYRLNRIYAKWVLSILLLFIISCEKEPIYECKECTSVSKYETFTIFVCGDELKKYESLNNSETKTTCITKPCKQ
jgi:hypothetical protein